MILTGVECHVSSSLYRAVEVGADSLATLSRTASLSMENVMLCGLSCSSRDCPGFSYSEDSKLCTRLETDCLQDLMYMGVVTKRQVAANFLKVLSYLHAERRSQVTQNMLARLYSPILWRYLKVANHTVRLNATVMFLEAYPLEDLEQTREERDTSREKQHSFIVLLMRDVDPRIRVEAIKGVCRILALYWQLVSSDFINKVISILFKETVVDSSSPKVRMATLIGISNILSNPPSHVYLKSILGKLSSCIHDTNDGVRAAFLDLLLVVKGNNCVSVDL